MFSSTLLIILKSFSKEEIKRFDEFLRSPFFNKNSNVLKLFTVVKKHHPELSSQSLNREKIWRVLFPDKDFNYGVMKNLIFELQKHSEKFIGLQIYEDNKSDQDRNLLKSLTNRDLDQQFEKNLKVFKTHLSKLPDSTNNFYYGYLAEANEQNYLSYKYKTKDENFCNPGLMNYNLISFFLTNFFSENYNSLHDSLLYNKTYDTITLNTVFKFFKNSPVKDNEFVLMNYYTLKTLTDKDDDSSFNDLKKLLYKNYKSLEHEKVYNFSMALVNFCTLKIMKGNPDYIKEQFGIYKFMIEKNYYYTSSEKFINPNMYVNAVSMAGNLKKFDWAEKFILKFKNNLHPIYRDRYFALANVSLNIKKKKFDHALSFLSDFKCINAIDKITLKRFQLIIYYESGYFDELYSLIDSSKHFISNDEKVTVSPKTIFENFLKFTLKLSDVKSGKNKKYDKYFLKSLSDEIRDSDVSNKIWLLEKTSELDKGK